MQAVAIVILDTRARVDGPHNRPRLDSSWPRDPCPWLACVAVPLIRILKGIGYVLAHLVFGGLGIIAIMFVVAVIVENMSDNDEAHDRCLKHATNGYEIKQCR